jgi:hypothetical protein
LISIATKAKRIAIAASAVALLAGCGAPRLEPDVPAGVSLVGAWHLNRQASADPNALIAAIVEKEMKHMRRRSDDAFEDDETGETGETRRGSGGGPSGNGGNRGGSSSSAEGRSPGGGGLGGGLHPRGGMAAFIRSQYTQALGPLLEGEAVVIEQSADRFVVARGDSRRTYTPGGHSVVSVADGVADQTSGWKGREYVIDVRPQVGPHLTERYSLTTDGQLIEKVWLGNDGLPKLEFARVYEKGLPPARALPTSN